MKTIKTFIDYLTSDEEKYKINYQNKMFPYSYKIKIIDFIEYWNRSKYNCNQYLKDFDSYKDYNEINIFKQNYDFIVNTITYIIRYERFSNGLIANNLEYLKQLLERLVELEKEEQI